MHVKEERNDRYHDTAKRTNLRSNQEAPLGTVKNAKFKEDQHGVLEKQCFIAMGNFFFF